MWFSIVVEMIEVWLLVSSFVGMFLFVPLALFGLLFSPFAAAICARTAREQGLDSSFFAWKGFAFSILYLVPCFYLISRIQGTETARGPAVFGYVFLYYTWMVVGIIAVIIFVSGEVDRVIINPMHVGDRGDLGALLWLVPAPIANAILWVVSLRSLIRRDRRDRENSAAATIIPDRAYTNPFGFSLIGSVATLILFIISVGIRFSN